MKKLLVLSAAMFALAAVACGGGDAKPPTDPSGTTNTTGTPDPSKADPKNAPSTPSTGTAPATTGTAPATPEAPKK